VVTKVADDYATSAFGVEDGEGKLLQNSGKPLTGYMVAPPGPEFKVQPP